MRHVSKTRQILARLTVSLSDFLLIQGASLQVFFDALCSSGERRCNSVRERSLALALHWANPSNLLDSQNFEATAKGYFSF